MTLTPRATATIAHILKGIDFPCTRAGIIKYARRQGVEAASLQLLKELPVQRYASMADVFVGVGVADRKYYEDKPEDTQAAPPEMEPETAEVRAPQPEARPQPRQAADGHRSSRPSPRFESESILVPMLWFWPMAMIRLSQSSIELMRRIMTAYGWPPR